ncbi:ATP-binding protein [Pleionea sp. CnH1-48]|uniref:ATP-binding protein n=1 Tax=Pleionea sp. CnH1-48 TaxID=2954494 RepID=UPI002097F291|nr:ATP-binding protein [Pleionea sp. CnH1-48]MCO7227471.1 ATP-binding protein [Pleionea sp. CnH1-48]
MAEEYSAESIKVIRDLDGVRKRPGMYIGDTEDGSGLVNMLMEVVSNSVDQFLAGKSSFIKVNLFKNGSMEVIDDGEGIPVFEVDGLSAIEAIMTQLHCTATWDNHRPHTHVGTLHGVGLAVVNALCRYCEIDSYKDGVHWHIRFEEGKSQGLENRGETKKVGTRMLFSPDPKYFSSLNIDEEVIASRFEELSFLCAGLTCQLTGRNGKTESYCHPKGLAAYLDKILPKQDVLALNSLHFNVVEDDIRVELALGWSEGEGHCHSFANHLCTIDGGVHVSAVVHGVARAIDAVSDSSETVNNSV